LIRVQPVEFGEKRHRIVVCRAGFRGFAREIQLDTIARRKQHSFRLGIAAAKAGQRLGRLLAAKCQPLPHFDGCCVMAAADHAQFHERPSNGGFSGAARGSPCFDPPTSNIAMTSARNKKLATVRYATLRPCWAGLYSHSNSVAARSQASKMAEVI